MKFQTIPALAALGVIASVGLASFAEAQIAPTEARTYCKSDTMRRVLAGAVVTTTQGSANPALVADNEVTAGGNEVVWQVIGALPQSAPGEAYCGYLAINNFQYALNNYADGIEDCVGVLQYAIPAAPEPPVVASSGPVAVAGYTSCRLEWNGSSVGGVNLNLAVSICSPNADEVAQGNWVDNYGASDCIIDGLDFAGGTFAAIHDVQNQKADNTVGIVGGVSDLTFLGGFPSRSIELSAAAVAKINAAQESTLDFIVRCGDESGHENGFLGGGSNALVLHDPPGVGLGTPGDMSLVCE